MILIMVTNVSATENLSLRENGWKIEYLYVKDIRELKKDWIHPKFLVNWLLEADIHVILCQGVHLGMQELWLPLDCRNEILRLEFHPGIPGKAQLRCPVFNGDKFSYLNAARKFTNPSFKIPLGQRDKERMKQTIKLAKE